MCSRARENPRRWVSRALLPCDRRAECCRDTRRTTLYLENQGGQTAEALVPIVRVPVLPLLLADNPRRSKQPPAAVTTTYIHVSTLCTLNQAFGEWVNVKFELNAQNVQLCLYTDIAISRRVRGEKI